MHYVVVSGSHRKDSQSSKVSNWLAEQVRKGGNDADVIDLSGNPVPLWDESAWNADSDLSAEMKPYLEKLQKADAVILVSPEWHGMVPGGLKNFLLYVSAKEVAHKPVLLVGVSASIGGTYPIAELRSSGYKNNRMVYIPDHLIVRNVEKVMNDHDIGDDKSEDNYIKRRALFSLDVLSAYAASLKTMRDNNDLLHDDYPNGM